MNAQQNKTSAQVVDSAKSADLKQYPQLVEFTIS
jgi:hypothetical protein